MTEKDIGDLLMLKFKWEESNGWSTSSMLKMVSTWWSGDSDGANMEVHKIRIRAGETQQKYVGTCFFLLGGWGVGGEQTFTKKSSV